MSEIDVVLSKINVIKNCLMALERATLNEKDPDFKLAIYELNLQRATQASIDLANIIIAKEGLGLPNTYKQSFELLYKHAVISMELCKKLCSMVGFRNISIHDYAQIKPAIVHSIITNHLNDFEEFYTIILKRAQNWQS